MQVSRRGTPPVRKAHSGLHLVLVLSTWPSSTVELNVALSLEIGCRESRCTANQRQHQERLSREPLLVALRTKGLLLVPLLVQLSDIMICPYEHK